MNVTLKPVIKWAGGKRAVMGELEKRLPNNFRNYYEPFLGGGSVLNHLQNTGKIQHNVFASDISEPLVNLYHIIQHHVDALIAMLKSDAFQWGSDASEARQRFLLHRERFNLLKLQSHSILAESIASANNLTSDALFRDVLLKQHSVPVRAFLKDMATGKYKTPLRDALTLEEQVEFAALFIFLNKVGFNGMYRENSFGLYNIPPGKSNSKPQIFDEHLLASLSKSWDANRFTFYCLSFQEAVKSVKRGDFVYLDPPYDGDSTMFTAYTGNAFKDAEQQALRDTFVELDKRGAYVMLSNAATERIFELYSNYRIEKINVKRCINSKGNDRKNVVQEVIVTNYEYDV